MPKKLKEYKIATLFFLKEIIENADLVADNIENLHEKNGYMFAYLISEVQIDEEIVSVRISVKKKVGTNWFWIHNIDQNKKSSKLLDPIVKTELKEIQNF